MDERDWDQETDAGWYRRKVGQRIERAANRAIGTIMAAIGLLAIGLTLSSDAFSLSSHWPGLVFAAVFLLLARLAFKARRSIIIGFGEEADSARRKRKD